MIIRCSRHSLDRYREHHCDATYQTLNYALEESTELDFEIVKSLTNRGWMKKTGDIYKCSPDGFGIFVVRTVKRPGGYEEGIIVTYLISGMMQTNFLREHVLSLPPIDNVLNLRPLPEDIIKYMSADEMEKRAIAALKNNVHVKLTKDKNTIAIKGQVSCIIKEADSIRALALWHCMYMEEEGDNDEV